MRRPQVSATTPVGASNSTMPSGEERIRRERLDVAEPGVEKEEGVDAPDEGSGERGEQGEQQVGALDLLSRVGHNGRYDGREERRNKRVRILERGDSVSKIRLLS